MGKLVSGRWNSPKGELMLRLRRSHPEERSDEGSLGIELSYKTIYKQNIDLPSN